MELQQSSIVIDSGRIVSALFALILLLGSAPLTTGLFVVIGPSHPELAMNFCHPLESATASAPILLARPASAAMRPALVEFERMRPDAETPLTEFSLEPESPPPESAT